MFLRAERESLTVADDVLDETGLLGLASGGWGGATRRGFAFGKTPGRFNS